MSGGHWNYSSHRIESDLSEVGKDFAVHVRFPKLAASYRMLAKLLSETEHDLDWDLSGDTEIVDDGQYDLEFINSLSRIVSDAKEVKREVVHGI